MGSLIGEQVISLRDKCTARRPVHFFRKVALGAAAMMFAVLPTSAVAAGGKPEVPVVQNQLAGGQSVADFYRGRNNYPLWLSPTAGDAAEQLLNLLSSANLDGLDPHKYHV